MRYTISYSKFRGHGRNNSIYYEFYDGLKVLKDRMEWEEYKTKPHDMWYAWCGL